MQRRRRSRRDRRGRGLRGLLYPADMPAARSRTERFDALVIEALEPIEARWRTELTDLTSLYNARGQEALNSALIERTLREGPYLYRLATPQGKTITGNIGVSPGGNLTC